MWKDRRVLVTGSSGVIGRVLVKLLVEAGADVLSVDIRDSEFIEVPVKHIRVDLSKATPAKLSEFEPQVVFHLAATFERTVEKTGYWLTSFENNVLLSHRLLQTVARISSVETFVFASSYLVYDSRQYLDTYHMHSLKETDNIRPRNLVGAAKYLFEQELDFVGNVEQRFETTSARIFRVYGRGSRDVISRWIRLALTEKPLEVFGRNNWFDFIFADDVAEGLLRLANTDKTVVNLGSGVDFGIRSVLKILKTHIPNIEINYLDHDYQRETAKADMSLFANLTGWTPQTTLEEGIKNIIEYERKRLAYEIL